MGPLLQETSSLDRKGTETNKMESNDLEVCGKKCYYWFHSEVKVLTRFYVFLDLVIFDFRFLCSKELYLHLFCVISMFLRGRMLILKI